MAPRRSRRSSRPRGNSATKARSIFSRFTGKRLNVERSRSRCPKSSSAISAPARRCLRSVRAPGRSRRAQPIRSPRSAPASERVRWPAIARRRPDRSQASRNCSPETLTAMRTSAGQSAARLQRFVEDPFAEFVNHPSLSAMSMNSSGGIRPSGGCRQRASASKPRSDRRAKFARADIAGRNLRVRAHCACPARAPVDCARGLRRGPAAGRGVAEFALGPIEGDVGGANSAPASAPSAGAIA